MAVKLIPGVLSSLILGVGLGFVPGLNERLHWNLWFILPISGFFFGMVAGLIQFGTCYALDRRIGRWAFIIFSLAATAGYALVDYGTYRSTTVHLDDAGALPDGDYGLPDLITFRDYMSWRLGSSTVFTRHGTRLYDMGTTGTRFHTSSSMYVHLGGPMRIAHWCKGVPLLVEESHRSLNIERSKAAALVLSRLSNQLQERLIVCEEDGASHLIIANGEQPDGAARALHYELEAFRASAKHFMDLQARVNGALENTLLHARNLLDFFTGSRPYKGAWDESDIRAGYFVHGKDWWKSSELPYLRAQKANINKSLSHLTFDRIEEDYKWNVAQIMQEIEAAYAEFLGRLPLEERPEWARMAETHGSGNRAESTPAPEQCE